MVKIIASRILLVVVITLSYCRSTSIRYQKKKISWSVTVSNKNLTFDCSKRKCRIKITIYIHFLITVPTRPTSGKPHRPPTIDDGADYTKKTSYTCENCDKMYSKAKDLEIHMSYCTGWKNTYIVLVKQSICHIVLAENPYIVLAKQSICHIVLAE